MKRLSSRVIDIWQYATHESLARLATILGFLIASFALIYSARQFHESVILTREMNSDNMWTGYMELSMDNPQFAEGADYARLSASEQVRYSWMFDRLAYTAESILEIYPNDAQWVSVFDIELGKHKSLIDNHPRIVPHYFCDYSPIVRSLMAKHSAMAQTRHKECTRLEGRSADA